MTDSRPSDFCRQPLTALFAWGLPAALMVFADSLGRLGPFAWAGGALWIGIACLLNARRCARVHCFFTGPFFLALGLVALAAALEWVRLDSAGWSWLGIVALAGGLTLSLIPEWLWGQY
ncbi:MAG: hypothetical protein ACRD0X_03565, partial [Thermoanaerobaculia bacterium]